ncbi:MAG: class I SAM-dependent rRNA methyltransferase [Bacteroidales bacterium]
MQTNTNPALSKIILKKGKEEALLRFHPWVFSGAIARSEGTVQDGDVVEVFSSEGKALGMGHAQMGSIAVRMLSFTPQQNIDVAFWEEKLRTAYQLRKNLGILSTNTNCYRLVHGEGDGLSGLIIDIYGHTAVLQTHSSGMYLAKDAITEALNKVLHFSNLSIYCKSKSSLFAEDAEDAYLIGAKKEESIVENGVKFDVDWELGQKTGLFLDQRDNRALLESYSKDAKVLNMFCYTGGFSVYALRGKASSVTSVDSSARAIEQTKRNVELNFNNEARHEALLADGFEFLQTMKNDYNCVVLDPPSFAKHQNAVKNALQAYRRLNALALKKMSKGSLLFTFSCSQVISKEQFRSAVFSAAIDAQRQVQILHQLSQPADHPISIFHPEGEYLKGLVLMVN